jgi:hypothetical protein
MARTMGAILRDPPDLTRKGSGAISVGLLVIIRRLLAKLPDERYPSAAALRTDLAELTAIAEIVSATRGSPYFLQE